MADEEQKAVKTKTKKLTKDLTTKEGSVIITVADGEKGPVSFDFKRLPAAVQEKFGPFGLGHKLGDAAAGRSGKDAEASILKVWEGLMKGDWSVRAPAAPKISVAEVSANFSKLDPKEQAVAKKLLEGLGITIPGVS